MRIFLTGATGYIGSAALDAFLRAGFHITALVRTREQAERLEARGVQTVAGNLADAKSYRQAAAGCDGFVLTAFEYSERGPALDRNAIDTCLELAAARPSGVVIYTSGVWVLGLQRKAVDEQAPVQPIAQVAFRPAHERAVLEAGGGALRTLVVRPGLVYGGARGIIADLFKDARNGLMRVIGSGENHWPLVYDRDLGDLYARLAADAGASGLFHANDEGDERVIDVVNAIAGVMDQRPEIRYMPIDEARAKMGPYADALALDQIIRSPRARALGWTPTLSAVAPNAPRLLEEWRNGAT
jgi:nucleoside-diphosphate-sugar epimerase